jgi:hypothetical protein
MYLKSYFILGVATCLLTALADLRGWQTPTIFPTGGSGSYYGGHGSGSSSRGSGGYFSGWGGGK